MSGENLPLWIGDLIGLPYVTGGNEPTGLDCWGLYQLAHQTHFGWRLPEYEGPLWFSGQKAGAMGPEVEAYADQWTIVTPGEERMGDCALWRMRGHPIHVGFVLPGRRMLHIEEKSDSVVEGYDGKRWDGRLVNFYRTVRRDGTGRRDPAATPAAAG